MNQVNHDISMDAWYVNGNWYFSIAGGPHPTKDAALAAARKLVPDMPADSSTFDPIDTHLRN